MPSDSRSHTVRGRVAAARSMVRQRPGMWSVLVATSVGAATVIWFAMNGLGLEVRIPIILVAAALNLLIGAAYAADFRENDHDG